MKRSDPKYIVISDNAAKKFLGKRDLFKVIWELILEDEDE